MTTAAGVDVAGQVYDFVKESNAIEGIHRDPTDDELEATVAFLDLEKVTVAHMEVLVQCYAGAPLREKFGQNVRVGSHFPPRGGPLVRKDLMDLLKAAHSVGRSSTTPGTRPYLVHQRYEQLHPFMDGNGRSGRTLWYWQMKRQEQWRLLDLGFLHAWYYASLAEYPGRGGS